MPALHMTPSPEIGAADTPRFAEVIAPLSCALDLVEGQPEGHAARTCLIGQHIADALRLTEDDRHAVFYTTLLKDLGSSSNAAKLSFLFGADDRALKRDLRVTDWARTPADESVLAGAFGFGSSLDTPELQSIVQALEGPNAARRLVQIRGDRGAVMARRLGLPEAVATAIVQLDEHWDGRGRPAGLQGQGIVLAARIAGLAQAVEAFHASYGARAAIDMVRQRRGRWFDPELADVVLALDRQNAFWESLAAPEPWDALTGSACSFDSQPVDDRALDRIAEVFADVVDAKSPWTFRHSAGVARIVEGIAGTMQSSTDDIRKLRRAALLHDIGKLGVSNQILDKPGPLDDAQSAELQGHCRHSERILARTPGFRDSAAIAGAHHERLDGSGYHRGLASAALGRPARLLAVADVLEALSASRPYRNALAPEDVGRHLTKAAGKTLCADCVAAALKWRERTDLTNRVDAQLEMLEVALAESA